MIYDDDIIIEKVKVKRRSNYIARAAISELYREVQRWEIQKALCRSSIGAFTFLVFIKFMADRKHELGIKNLDIGNSDEHIDSFSAEKLFFQIRESVHVLEKRIALNERFSEELISSFVDNINFTELKAHLDHLLKNIQHIDFHTESDRKANFQYIIGLIPCLARRSGKDTEKLCSNFYVGQLLNGVIDLQNGMNIYDPCAGLGLTLIEALYGKKRICVYAQEIDRTAAAVLKMLLIMNGCTNFIVQCNDTLMNPLTNIYTQKFDRIVSEPPIKVKIDAPDYDVYLAKNFTEYINHGTNDSWLFVKHMIASLNTTGRAAILLPMSMMSREGVVSNFRLWLLEQNLIDCIIELPVGVLSTAGVKATILVLQKSRKNNAVYMMDLSRGLWNNKVKCSGNPATGISEFVSMITKRKEAEGISKLIDPEIIIRNHGQLAVSQYIDRKTDIGDYLRDPEELLKETKQLNKTYRALCEKYDTALTDYLNIHDKTEAMNHAGKKISYQKL